MKNKEYYKETQAALDAFAIHCVYKECEQCWFYRRKNDVYGCFGFWLEAEADIVLEPCPHCGGKAEVCTLDSCSWVECTDCGCKTGKDTDHLLVIDIWNSRAKAPALKKEGGQKPVEDPPPPQGD